MLVLLTKPCISDVVSSGDGVICIAAKKDSRHRPETIEAGKKRS